MALFPTLKIGSVGPYVKRLQMNLNGLGLNYNGFIINGIFDIKTRNVVQNFQDRFKLTRDGIVGPVTWSVLNKNVKAVQRQLNLRRYNVGNPDGLFGKFTIYAIKTFQRNNRLYLSGIVDPRTRKSLFNPLSKDNFEYRPSSNAISSLNPYVASLASKFLELNHANNLDVRISTAFRSWDEEDRLYAQGRTIPGDIVTNARGGDSYHNWGLAFDAEPFENGKISNDMKKYLKMGKLGQKVGLEWGGTFKSIVDLPHFQYTFNLNTWDLLDGVRPHI